MACGTGKTIVLQEYLKINDCHNKKNIILFPSLYLISQVYKQLKTNLSKDYNFLCI